MVSLASEPDIDDNRASGVGGAAWSAIAPDPRTVTLHALEHGLSVDAARQALISQTNTSVVVDTEVQPDFGDNLYETCLATQGAAATDMVQGVLMTPEALYFRRMFEMADAALGELKAENARLRAAAPVELYGVSEQQLDALRAENAELMRLLGVQNAWIAELNAKKAAFGDPTPADLPDPPRRPDGTLVPQAKPFPVVKTAEPSRRVGG